MKTSKSAWHFPEPSHWHNCPSHWPWTGRPSRSRPPVHHTSNRTRNTARTRRFSGQSTTVPTWSPPLAWRGISARKLQTTVSARSSGNYTSPLPPTVRGCSSRTHNSRPWRRWGERCRDKKWRSVGSVVWPLPFSPTFRGHCGGSVGVGGEGRGDCGAWRRIPPVESPGPVRGTRSRARWGRLASWRGCGCRRGRRRQPSPRPRLWWRARRWFGRRGGARRKSEILSIGWRWRRWSSACPRPGTNWWRGWPT